VNRRARNKVQVFYSISDFDKSAQTQTNRHFLFWFLSFISACLVAKQTQKLTGTFVPFLFITACLHFSKANTKTNRHLCSFPFYYSLSSFQQMQTQISRQFSFLLYPSLPVTNKNK
jgi:hypothetical protein